MIKIKLYIGTETEFEGDLEDYMYLDMSISGRTVQLWRSEDSINDSSPQDFEDSLIEALNEYSIWSRNIPDSKLHVHMETIEEIISEFPEENQKSIKKLIKEAL